jgi:hypothetical protein
LGDEDKRTIKVFCAWQSDRDQEGNRHFIRRALDDAARSINEDNAIGVEIEIDADTEGVVGTPPVTETILAKIRSSDIFVPDLTFIPETPAGKLIPNPNVMVEYGYALRSLRFDAMMPVMNTHCGAPTELPLLMAGFGVVALVLERSEVRLRRAATRDGLTGLANRQSLISRFPPLSAKRLVFSSRWLCS